MALVFEGTPVATLKGKTAAGESLSVAGITSGTIAVDTAVLHANKLLDIGGKVMLANGNVKREKIEEATDDGE